jgi:hypothetical protein
VIDQYFYLKEGEVPFDGYEAHIEVVNRCNQLHEELNAAICADDVPSAVKVLVESEKESELNKKRFNLPYKLVKYMSFIRSKKMLKALIEHGVQFEPCDHGTPFRSDGELWSSVFVEEKAIFARIDVKPKKSRSIQKILSLERIKQIERGEVDFWMWGITNAPKAAIGAWVEALVKIEKEDRETILRFVTDSKIGKESKHLILEKVWRSNWFKTQVEKEGFQPWLLEMLWLGGIRIEGGGLLRILGEALSESVRKELVGKMWEHVIKDSGGFHANSLALEALSTGAWATHSVDTLGSYGLSAEKVWQWEMKKFSGGAKTKRYSDVSLAFQCFKRWDGVRPEAVCKEGLKLLTWGALTCAKIDAVQGRRIDEQELDSLQEKREKLVRHWVERGESAVIMEMLKSIDVVRENEGGPMKDFGRMRQNVERVMLQTQSRANPESVEMRRKAL